MSWLGTTTSIERRLDRVDDAVRRHVTGLGAAGASSGARAGLSADPLGSWKGSSIGDWWAGFASRNKIPGWAPGMLAYAATGSAAGAGVVSACAAGRAGLVTPAMNLSTSMMELSMERQGKVPVGVLNTGAYCSEVLFLRSQPILFRIPTQLRSAVR